MLGYREVIDSAFPLALNPEEKLLTLLYVFGRDAFGSSFLHHQLYKLVV